MNFLNRRARLTAIGLAFGLAVTACGSSSDNAEESSGGTLEIGALFAMTGEGSFYGEVMSAGSELGATEVNTNKGADGYKFKLHIEDHQSGKVDAAVSAAHKLIDINHIAVLLSSYTGPTVAVQPLAVSQGILVFNGGGVGDDLVGKENLYNNRMLGAQLLPSLVTWEAKKIDAKKVATIFWNDAAGKSDNDATKDGCKKAGCQVVAEEPHEVGATDYSTELARIKSKNPDMLVVGSYGNDVGYIIQQARQVGLTVPIIGNEWTPDAAKIAGAAMDGYTAIIDRFDPSTDDPQGKKFTEAYKKKNNKDPEFYAANYYDLVRFVIPDLIKSATKDGKDAKKPGVLADEMKKAVKAGHKFETVYGDAMVFNKDGTVQKPAAVFKADATGSIKVIAQFEDGKIKEGG